MSYLKTTLPPSALRRQHFPGESPTPSYLSPLQIPTHHACFGQYTDPPSAIGFWIALEKCTPENGALSFLPGSHLTAPITKRFVRKPEGGTGFETLIPPAQVPPKPEGKYILEACMPGASLPVAYSHHVIDCALAMLQAIWCSSMAACCTSPRRT